MSSIAALALAFAHRLNLASYELRIVNDAFFGEPTIANDAFFGEPTIDLGSNSDDFMVLYTPLICRECEIALDRINPRTLPRKIKVGDRIVSVGFTHANQPYQGADVWVGIEGSGVTITIDPDKATTDLVMRSAYALALMS